MVCYFIKISLITVFISVPKSEIGSPNPDVKPDLPPGTIPATGNSMNFNPSVPPPNFPIRLPATNLTNLGRPPSNFQRPPMGNFYNHSGMMGSSMNMNAPPPSMHRQQSHEGPPGVGGSRSNMEGPPGTETESFRSNRRDRDRRRDSDGSLVFLFFGFFVIIVHVLVMMIVAAEDAIVTVKEIERRVDPADVLQDRVRLGIVHHPIVIEIVVMKENVEAVATEMTENLPVPPPEGIKMMNVIHLVATDAIEMIPGKRTQTI